MDWNTVNASRCVTCSPPQPSGSQLKITSSFQNQLNLPTPTTRLLERPGVGVNDDMRRLLMDRMPAKFGRGQFLRFAGSNWRRMTETSVFPRNLPTVTFYSIILSSSRSLNNGSVDHDHDEDRF